MRIAILILGAGRSSRMGTAKQLLPIGETTLLGVTLESALASEADAVFCVLGSQINDISLSIEQYGIEIIENSNYMNGLSSSIAEGILHLQEKDFDAVLIMLGDQPFIQASYLNEMIDTYRNHPKKIIASNYSDKVGVPVILSSTFFPELLKLRGDVGAGPFLNAHKEHIIQLRNNGLMDVDTQEDYQDLLKSRKTK